MSVLSLSSVPLSGAFAGASSYATQRWRRLGQVLPALDGSDVWDQGPGSPHVFEWNGKLRMYYEGRQPFTMAGGRQEYRLRIGVAEASLDDPLTWHKLPGNPVLDVGPDGAPDSYWAGYPWIVRVTPTHWHMYYAAWDGRYQSYGDYRRMWCTTMAESDDAGVTWTRSGRRLFEMGRSGACDQNGSGSCSVLKVGDDYWMWYTAILMPRTDFYRISTALAISRDGGHTFEPHPAGAVMAIPPQLGSPGATCSKPYVEFTGGKFRMWFSCAKDGRHYRIHYAESDDGIGFKWNPEPVLDVSGRDGWDWQMVCYPSIVHVGNRSLMFYSGSGRNPRERLDGIGVAELEPASVADSLGASSRA